jgi:hypothetical protein
MTKICSYRLHLALVEEKQYGKLIHKMNRSQEKKIYGETSEKDTPSSACRE